METKKKEFLFEIGQIAITCILVLLFIKFVAQFTVVRGASMMPTFHNRDLCLMEKITPGFGTLKRNDVVVFKSGVPGKPFFIKRIIGLPGESVSITEDGEIYIDDVAYEDEYGAERIYNPGLAADKITLGQEEYFVLGDNRNNSNDSRFLGPVSKKSIEGRVILNLAPSRSPYRKVNTNAT